MAKPGNFVEVKLNTKRLDKIALDLVNAAKLRVTIGVQGKEARTLYRDEDGQSTGVTIGTMMAIHELGLGVPKRPILKIAAHVKRTRIGRIQTLAMRRLIVDKRSTVLSVLKEAGADIALEYEKVFIQTRRWVKANAASTVAKKGFDYPLHDSFLLSDSLTYAVRSKSDAIVAKGTANG